MHYNNAIYLCCIFKSNDSFLKLHAQQSSTEYQNIYQMRTASLQSGWCAINIELGDPRINYAVFLICYEGIVFCLDIQELFSLRKNLSMKRQLNIYQLVFTTAGSLLPDPRYYTREFRGFTPCVHHTSHLNNVLTETRHINITNSQYALCTVGLTINLGLRRLYKRLESAVSICIFICVRVQGSRHIVLLLLPIICLSILYENRNTMYYN